MSEIIECQIKIDQEEWIPCEKRTENLYVRKWEPEIYTGIHSIEVSVKDADGRSKLVCF